ncbi:MAG: diguanylate cyclase [Deltaproteobacteria bacterium]|nr:diguanylate cyclase [Deltaproteobacteria bacterium]
MFSVKKSLRAKFTLVLLIVGIIPLMITSAFFYYTAKDALFKNVFKELKWNIGEISGQIENHFSEAGKDLMVASQNAAFRMYLLDPANRSNWVKEQQKTLKHLRGLYPDIIDEACFIDSTGQEISRIVFDQIAQEGELSSDEERSSFFKSAFDMDEGEVYQGKPTISEDTKRWVLPNATPVIINGKKAAILHFEVTMSHFQNLLKRTINPDRGYGFILNDKGEFMGNTLADINESAPFARAITDGTPPTLRHVYERMLGGESGIEQFTDGVKDYYVIFQPMGSVYIKGRNDNRWYIAYAIPSDRVYVELAILRYNILAFASTLVFVIALAYLIGNYITRPIRELAGATNRVANGEMPKITTKREDEIGQLSESFNVMVEAVKRRDEALKALAITDGLTGVYNYRYFKEELEKGVRNSLRYGRPMSLIMLDVDHFKAYNDAYGHPQGDMVLKKLAGVLMKCVREVDLPARYGGEEFVVILPETVSEGAFKTAERIRAKVEEEMIEPGGGNIITVSIGVATLPGDADSGVSLIEAVDRALYRAKEAGRNRVKRAGE